MKRLPDLPPERLVDSTLFWLAVLKSARRSKDVLLESIARHRLTAMGARVVFDDEVPPPPNNNEGGRTHE